VILLDAIPGIGDLLGLTLASEIGDAARFGSPRKLIGYAGLAPKISQSGDRSRTGALSKGRLADAALGRRRGRPTRLATHEPVAPGIEKPRQLPRTLCAHPSAEREMSPPQPRPASREADPRGGA
jgi:hypothetical protein